MIGWIWNFSGGFLKKVLVQDELVGFLVVLIIPISLFY